MRAHPLLFALPALAAGLFAQAPTAPVISARGVTNYFTQDPAPGTIGLGGLVQINGLNLGPPEGATADTIPWTTRLGGTQVIIGGKAAPIASVTPGTIVAQVPLDANPGLVNVIVRRDGVNSAAAKVNVAAMNPSIRTADSSGSGVPWGKVTLQTIVTTASGLGPTEPKLENGDVGPADTPAVPAAAIEAFVGGLRAKVTATASTTRPGEFDVTITVPQGARAGDLITFLAGRQAANATLFRPMTDPNVTFLPLPANSPAITTLADSGVNGSFLLATGNRTTDGCYPAISVDVRARKSAVLTDCLTSVNPNIQPLVVPPNGDSIGALVGPPAGDAQTGISSTVKIFSGAGDPIKVDLPSAASTLNSTPLGFVATLPGKTPQIATINPFTGEVTVSPAAASGAGGAGGGGGAPGGIGGPALTVDVNGLKQIYASANVGQNRIAVIVGDDALKPTKAAFAIVSNTGTVAFSREFPGNWLPLLTAVTPPRPNQTQPILPTEPFFFDPGTRRVYALARASDASKDAFVAFALTDTDPALVSFPEGWFATSCTADIRLFPLDLVGQLALVGSKVAEPEFKTSCPGSGFLMLDFTEGKMTAIPVGDAGQIRVPVTRADLSMTQMNNYVYALKLDSTRATTADTLYVLDGVNANVFAMPVPSTVTAFTNASLQEIPELNAVLAQTFDKLGGDQGFVLFNLDAQTVSNLPLPEGFATVNNLTDGTAVCCLATRKLVARALKQGGSSVVIYDLATGDVTVATNPDNVTGIGPPPAAGNGGQQAINAARVVLANAQANTVSAVAYNNNRQVGIIVVRIP